MALSATAQRVQDELRRAGFANTVQEFADSTRSAAEAAATIGCTLAQIAKSIIFKAGSGRAVLVVASGVNRVDERKVAALIGDRIGKADAEFVRDRTGFVIGGVPPLGHATPSVTVIDADLLAFDRIWAAAGTPRSIFGLTPAELLAMSGGTVGDVKSVV
ncbi:MAG: YbaK/EbsC family protein [Alphaproteobacteria bacterium]|nr:YbaK/EbsC family protein [Alphaproteobacteria bacterium]